MNMTQFLNLCSRLSFSHFLQKNTLHRRGKPLLSVLAKGTHAVVFSICVGTSTATCTVHMCGCDMFQCCELIGTHHLGSFKGGSVWKVGREGGVGGGEGGGHQAN